MPRTTRKIVLVPLVAAALSVAGCSSVVPGTAAPAGAGGSAPAAGPAGAPTTTDDPVKWVDQVCAALVPLSETKPPKIDASDLQSTLDGLSQTFGALSTASGTALADLDKVGPSPTPNGDKVVEKLKTTLTTLQSISAESKSSLDKADAKDPSSLAGLEDTFGKYGELPDPTADLQQDPELKAAAEKADNCKKIRLTTGG